MTPYPRIAAALLSARWCITPAALAAIRNTFEAACAGRLRADEHMPMPGQPEDYEEAAPVMAEGILVVPVHGVCARYLSAMETDCGGLDLNDTEKTLREAQADPRVQGIVLHFNSPGGTVTGIPELASLIRTISETKPVIAFTDAQCCSAAYWLASACDSIVVTPTADVGSIGVYSALVDESAAWAQEGYKLELMKAGKHKAMGIPGLPLAPEDRALIQAEVDSIYAMFTADVVANRARNGATVAEDTMQGQTFMGGTAVAVGLADRVVGSLTDLLAALTMDGRATQ
jgi:protease-4